MAMAMNLMDNCCWATRGGEYGFWIDDWSFESAVRSNRRTFSWIEGEEKVRLASERWAKTKVFLPSIASSLVVIDFLLRAIVGLRPLRERNLSRVSAFDQLNNVFCIRNPEPESIKRYWIEIIPYRRRRRILGSLHFRTRRFVSIWRHLKVGRGLVERIWLASSRSFGLPAAFLAAGETGAFLSSGISNTQRSFESINWSGFTSFHWKRVEDVDRYSVPLPTR